MTVCVQWPGSFSDPLCCTGNLQSCKSGHPVIANWSQTSASEEGLLSLFLLPNSVFLCVLTNFMSLPQPSSL